MKPDPVCTGLARDGRTDPQSPTADPIDNYDLICYLTSTLINMLVNNMSADRLSTAFAALADPTRRAILARLALGDATVNELAEPFEMSLPAISRHLKVLEQAGMIAQSREKQWRPRRLEPKALKEASDWLDYYRQFWDQNFDRLAAYLKTLQAKGDGPKS